MPGSSTSCFTEANDYHADLAEIFAEFVVTLPGAFVARSAQTTLRHIHLLSAQEALSRVAYVSLPLEMVFISFSSDPALPLFWGGRALEPSEIMLHSRGERLHQRTDGRSCWDLIALPPASLAAFCRTETGSVFALPALGQILRPSPRDRMHLVRVCREAARLAETRPKILSHPEVVRAMEHDLAGLLARCLVDSEVRNETAAMRQAAEIMTRFEDLLATNPHRSLQAVELCQALSVSQHTLRSYCALFLGVSARRYIQQRRLKLVRAAILCADPQKARIADLARHGGFTGNSRFAQLYRAAYGEMPAATLRNAGSA